MDTYTSFIELPLRICIFGSYERGAALLKACLENRFIARNVSVAGVITDDPEQHPWLKRDRIWRYPEAYAKRFLIGNLVDNYNRSLPPAGKIPLFSGRIKTVGSQEPAKEFMKFLEACNANMALMGTFGQLVPQTVIDSFPAGFFNFHPTGIPVSWPNPHDAGPQPFENIIARGCKEACLAMHHVTRKFDEGPLIATTESVDVLPDATPVFLHEKTAHLVANCLEKFLRDHIDPERGYLIPKNFSSQWMS